jgi:hypothetical protein
VEVRHFLVELADDWRTFGEDVLCWWARLGSAAAGDQRRGVESADVGVIFLRQGESFVPMREEPYDAEDLLQALIAAHPQILAGDDRGERSRWALVKREAGVGSWSLDHLFLDQAGVPTLVEVKRSSDTRARREVVAQMLDYAANAAGYWTVETPSSIPPH